LLALGSAVRACRNERGLTLRALASRAQVSERFLSQLETGEGNISVARLQDVAEALGTTAAELLSAAPSSIQAKRVVSLLGVRGAGKSTLGAELARALDVPFYELDQLVSREAGMPLAALFEFHGEAYYRRMEREVLRRFLATHDEGVLATGGSIVTDAETFALLRERTTTVWLKARAHDHWNRVVRQGDLRPMKNRADAMSELKALLRARTQLYTQADHVVDTSNAGVEEATMRLASALGVCADRRHVPGSAGASAETKGRKETLAAPGRTQGRAPKQSNGKRA
jgi:XRE family aerobic/anaerobic benzoate catabolism transcriptional regulator